jgi:toxin ParE1/3/4
MKCIVHSAAKAELRRSRHWYENRQSGLGFELLDDVFAALETIEEKPRIGMRYLETPYRFHCTSRFPYVLYYLELEDHLCVMAIAHERRRAGYWKRRKPE